MLSERGTVLVLGRALQAPEVMLDDVVQARPGRFRLQRLRRAPKVEAPLRPGTYIPYGTTAEGYPWIGLSVFLLCNDVVPTCGPER